LLEERFFKVIGLEGMDVVPTATSPTRYETDDAHEAWKGALCRGHVGS
jgi:hypothetical protein